MRTRLRAALLSFGAVLMLAAADTPPPTVEYRGLCNASASVAIDGGLFLVADDEDAPTTSLRVYREGDPVGPVDVLDLSNDDLELDPSESLEVDLEGSARIGDRVYWIGSHSASKNAKSRPNRRRLFATKVTADDGHVRVRVVGEPYKDLIKDLDDDSDYHQFDLKAAAKRAPKEAGALSIEGLAGTPEGDLLIGFRNPVPGGKALIARLKNPKAVTEGKPAKFGPPSQLDLGGLGIRSLEWSESLEAYLIVGGLPGEGGCSRLFRWSGVSEAVPEAVPGVDLAGMNPEALFVEGRTATLLSDDGHRLLDGQERDCAAPGVQKSFRGIRVSLPSR